MAATDQRVDDPNRRTAQLHIRVTPELKRALKMHCVRRDTTEQQWVSALLEAELTREASDLWGTDASRRVAEQSAQ